VDSSSLPVLKRVLFFCAYLHTDSNAHLAECLFSELPAVLSSCALMLLLNAHLAEPSRILSDSASPSNSQQSSSSSTSCLRSMPTWQSSTELTTKFCLQLCFSYTALSPEVFSNLKDLPSPELLISVLCLSTSSSDSSEFRSASSVHWYSETAVLCHALLA
jgi:hypothetical protein